MAASLDHVAIHASDLAKSVAFYTSLFGFKEIPAPVPFARWLVMKNGVVLHIVTGRPGHQAQARSRWNHLALTCPDLGAFVTELEKRGIAWSDIEGRVRTAQSDIRGAGVKQIFIQDPDGYWIEINDVPAPR